MFSANLLYLSSLLFPNFQFSDVIDILTAFDFNDLELACINKRAIAFRSFDCFVRLLFEDSINKIL